MVAGVIGVVAAAVGFAANAVVGSPAGIAVGGCVGGVASVMYWHVWRREPLRPWVGRTWGAVRRWMTR